MAPRPTVRFQKMLNIAMIVVQSRISMAMPVAQTQQTGGPLGISPGGPQGPVPIGSGGYPNGTVFLPFKPSIRSVDTVLAMFSALLMTVTYAILIGPGTRLASTSKLPLAAIEANIGNLLSRAWPDKSTSSQVGVAAGTPSNAQEQDAIRLLYVGKMDNEEQRVARGIEQCKATPTGRLPRPPMWLTTGSLLTKYMVQLAVWEWIGVWLFLAMFVSTMAFNGFFTGERRPDSYPRLVVVLIYLVAFCVHAWYVWKTCRGFFTLLAAGASWSMLHKVSFASVDLNQLESRLAGGPEPAFRQLGRVVNPSGGSFPVYDSCLLKDVPLSNNTQNGTGPVSPDDKGTIETVNYWHEKELASTLEGGRVALERIVTNVMTLVGITITTGFAVWTSISSSLDSTTQLGSLALLASLTLGTGAMFSSAIELSVMLTSFRNLVFLKEILINGQAKAYVEKRLGKKMVVGFTQNTLDPQSVRMRDLTRHTSFWGLLLFGPGYTLLPSEADHSRQIGRASFELSVNVRGKAAILSTEGTDRHNRHPDGVSVNAINVCYLPQQAQT